MAIWAGPVPVACSCALLSFLEVLQILKQNWTLPCILLTRVVRSACFKMRHRDRHSFGPRTLEWACDPPKSGSEPLVWC